MTTLSTELFDHARELLRGKAERLTSSRLTVLAALLDAESAMSHGDVQTRVEQINPTHIDRVTVYRVLEWLTEIGLAHRVAGSDRVFRFSAQASGQTHGHFHCANCGRMFCIGGSSNESKSSPTKGIDASVKAMLPKGFVSGGIDLTISGRCAQCSADH